MEATWGLEGLLGPIVNHPDPQEIFPESRMSCVTPAAEALDAAEDPKDAPAESPGEAPAETSEVSETAGAAGGGPVGTSDATFWLRSLRVVKEILSRHNDVKKAKRIIAR